MSWYMHTPVRGAWLYLLLLLVSLNLYTNHHHLITYHKGACCISNDSEMWYSIIDMTAPKSTMCSLCTSCVMLTTFTPSSGVIIGRRQVMSIEQNCECHCLRTFACHTSTEKHVFVAFHVTAIWYRQASHQALFQASWLVCVRCVCHKSPKSTDTLSSSLAATSVMLSAGYRMQ